MLYIVWGGTVEKLLARSIDSVRRFYPDMPIHVVRGDEHPTHAMMQKSMLGSVTPYESTLFLDADTVVMGNLDSAFDRAEEFGLACCICECPWARRYGPAEGDNIEYNTGVIFFTHKGRPVFDAWQALALECPAASSWLAVDDSPRGMPYEDQAPFARAVRSCRFNPFVLPLNYNFRPKFYPTVFAPLKIWHDPMDPPAQLIKINTECESGRRLVSHVRHGIEEYKLP